jgi:hypothetical protein
MLAQQVVRPREPLGYGSEWNVQIAADLCAGVSSIEPQQDDLPVDIGQLRNGLRHRPVGACFLLVGLVRQLDLLPLHGPTLLRCAVGLLGHAVGDADEPCEERARLLQFAQAEVRPNEGFLSGLPRFFGIAQARAQVSPQGELVPLNQVPICPRIAVQARPHALFVRLRHRLLTSQQKRGLHIIVTEGVAFATGKSQFSAPKSGQLSLPQT